jgi:GNAT superfamily N-acetyltransferase
MPNHSYEIRTMARSEIDFAIELAAAEGWNPGLYDAEAFYAADPNGFLIGLLDGEPVSSISVVRYGQTYGFLGFYVVKPQYRKCGFGARIWAAGMAYLQGRDVGLDGVIAQVENYKKSGFVEAHSNMRYQGQADGAQSHPSDPRIVPLAKIAFEDLRTYDERLFPSERPEFLRAWINQPESIALGIVADSQLGGYTVLRKCQVGYKIGPLFADNEQFAEALYQAASHAIPHGTPIFLDVPEKKENPGALALAERHGMKKVFETARMYRMANSAKMNVPLKNWFGVTTFELG